MMITSPSESSVPPQASSKRGWVRAISVVLFILVILCCVFAAELAGRAYITRISGRMPVDFSAYQTDHIHQYDKELGWVMRPNVDVTLPKYRLTTNSLGLRNKELRDLEGQVRILALGDSRTFGEGADNDSTWPALLETKLNDYKPGHFEVINAGVSGYNSFQGLRYLETRGIKLNPNLVICAFGVNEWGKVEPGGAGWLEWEDLSSQWGIEALFRGAIRGCAAMIRKPPLGPREFRMSPGEYTDTLDCIGKLSRSHGSAFSVLYLPSVPEIGNTDIFGIRRLSEGIAGYCFAAYWDPTEAFSVPAEKDYVDPFHFTASGNALIASYLFEKITTEALF